MPEQIYPLIVVKFRFAGRAQPRSCQYSRFNFISRIWYHDQPFDLRTLAAFSTGWRFTRSV